VEPKHNEAFQQAIHLHNKGRIEEALGLYDKVLAHADGDPFVCYAAGSAAAQAGNFGIAIGLLETSVRGNPQNHEAWMNLGMSYRTVGRVDKGIACYQMALGLPIDADAKAALYGNLSGCYVNEGNPWKCLELADAGLAIKNLPQLHNHRALALLELGRYEEGFREYEHRFALPEFHVRKYGDDVPKWDGKPVEKLAIHGEQGLGDEILFLTMLQKVIPLAEEIHVECAARLLGLLQHSFRYSPEVKFYPTHEALMAAVKPDAWTAMGSLLNVLWPWERNAYLESSRQFPKGEKRRIGLSWRGGTMKTHEYYRNGPLDDWERLVGVAKAQGDEVISVQYGPAEGMAKMLGIPHNEIAIADLDSLAGLIKSCDLIVTVCNTTVHLAGALGVPCIVLVPSKPAWRYGITGDRSDWYDSVEYVRQREGESWSDVIPRVIVHPTFRGQA
jgi:tetratricopeptide (TPR) repeat protein